MASFDFFSKKRDNTHSSFKRNSWLPLFGFSAFLFLATASNTVRATELVMFEELGCEWCLIWNEEVGSQYKDTKVGKIAPLRRIMIDAPRTGAIKNIKSIRFTPTFVVLHKDKEIGRITGYPGEAFFWGYLEEIIEKIDRNQSRQTTNAH